MGDDGRRSLGLFVPPPPPPLRHPPDCDHDIISVTGLVQSQCFLPPHGGLVAQDRGFMQTEEVFLRKPISSGSDDGSNNHSTPFCDGCRRPKGRPAAASITGFPGNRTCPAIHREGPDTGRPHKNIIRFSQCLRFGCELFVHVRFSRSEKNKKIPCLSKSCRKIR